MPRRSLKYRRSKPRFARCFSRCRAGLIGALAQLALKKKQLTIEVEEELLHIGAARLAPGGLERGGVEVLYRDDLRKNSLNSLQKSTFFLFFMV
jgi:hypothetical protein